MTEFRVHDEIEINRVAENLYNDAWSRSKNAWCKTWAEASQELHAEYRAKAHRILDGMLLLPVEGVMPKPLSQIEIEEIPHVISVLMARWTQVVGSIPPLSGVGSIPHAPKDQQSAETVDYVGALQDLDIVLAPRDEDATQDFVEIETPNGYSVAVGTWRQDEDGGSRLRIRVPFTDLTKDSQQRAQRHG